MSGLTAVKGFRELVVYQKSRLLAREIYMHTKFFPKEEINYLTGQIRNSSRSIGSNIAEAWANRNDETRFISLLTNADGEQMATQHWIEIASDCGYIDPEAGGQMVKRCAEMGRMLNGMVEKAAVLCQSSQAVGEETSEYFIGTTNWSLPINNQQVE